jgi:hypothetical protein
MLAGGDVQDVVVVVRHAGEIAGGVVALDGLDPERLHRFARAWLGVARHAGDLVVRRENAAERGSDLAGHACHQQARALEHSGSSLWELSIAASSPSDERAYALHRQLVILSTEKAA